MKAFFMSALRTIIAILSAFCLMVIMVTAGNKCFSLVDCVEIALYGISYGLPAFLHLRSSSSTLNCTVRLLLLCTAVGFLFGYFEFMTSICFIVLLIPISVSFIKITKLMIRFDVWRRKRLRQFVEQSIP